MNNIFIHYRSRFIAKISWNKISHFSKNKTILNNSVRIFTSFMNNQIFWWLKQQDGDSKMELNRPTRLSILAIIFELEKTFNIQLSFMKKHSMTSPIRSFLFEWILQSWLSIKHNFIALTSFLHFFRYHFYCCSNHHE